MQNYDSDYIQSWDLLKSDVSSLSGKKIDIYRCIMFFVTSH